MISYLVNAYYLVGASSEFLNIIILNFKCENNFTIINKE